MVWLTLVVAAAPSVLLLTFFYLRDRFEREPVGHVAAHALFGGAMGYYVGRAKFGPRRSRRRVVDAALSLAVPSAFHGAYDYALRHHVSWQMWLIVAGLSTAFWGFVLRRVYRAQRA